MTRFNDPIAELLTRIRNAKAARHRYVDISLSKMKVFILKILKDRGFVEDFLVSDKTRLVRIFLKYNAERKSVIHGLKSVSTPGNRQYVSCDDIPIVDGGMGLAILSTSKGIMDDSAARNAKLGGELICKVW